MIAIEFGTGSGSGDFHLLAADILALTKLDWNNDALYGVTPVTISYSQRLARIISRVPALPDDSYQFRLFM